MPNCKQHAATEETTKYGLTTMITSKRLRMLVWKWKKDTVLALLCIEKQDSRGKPQASASSIDASEEQSNSDKYRSMREREATTYGPHRRKRVCGKLSSWPCTQASFFCCALEANVKDEEGCRAVFTEHGASASQMATFFSTVSKLLGMAGNTGDAISAYTQVKMTEASRLARSVTDWNKACDKNLQGLLSYRNQTKNCKQFCHVGDQIEDCNLVFPRCFVCRWLARFKTNVKRNIVRIWITHVCSNFMDVQEANRSFSQQCRVWNYFAGCSFTNGRVTSDSIWEFVFWKPLSCKPAKRNLDRHKRARVIPSLPHSDKCAFESIDHVPPNIPSSSHSTKLYLFEDKAAAIQMINKGRSPNPEARYKNAQSRVGLVVWESAFESFYCDTHTCDKRSIGGYFDQGIITTMQWHSLLTLWQLRRPYESKDVRSFSRKPFLLLTFRKAPSSVSSDDTIRECWPGMESIQVTSIEIRLRSG